MKPNYYLLSFMLLLPFPASSQKIALSDVSNFWAIANIKAPHKSTDYIVISRGFKKYGVNRLAILSDSLKPAAKNVNDSTILVGMYKQDPFENRYRHAIRLPHTHRILILMVDLIGFETSYTIATLWKEKQDTIEFQQTLPTVFEESIGGVSIEDVYPMASDSLYIIFNSGGRDGGSIWGKLLVARYLFPDRIDVFATFPYGGTNPFISKVAEDTICLKNARFLKTTHSLLLSIETHISRMNHDGSAGSTDTFELKDIKPF